MDKRSFRKTPVRPTPDKDPSYPTLNAFDEGRRSALRRIGGTLLGLGSLGALLGACGDRPLHTEPDQGVGPAGVAPLPDSRIDQGRPEVPDATGGVAPPPDARIDQHPPPDAEPDWPMAGVPRMPDAEIDHPSDGGPKQD
jgi:hypothetical protein